MSFSLLHSNVMHMPKASRYRLENGCVPLSDTHIALVVMRAIYLWHDEHCGFLHCDIASYGFFSRSLCPNLHITPTSSFILICLFVFHWSSFSTSAPAFFSCLAALFGYYIDLVMSSIFPCIATYTMGLCLGYCQDKGRLIFYPGVKSS